MEQDPVQAAEIEFPPLATTPSSSFRCDGRTRCTQMSSCAEARQFLQHCPDVELDGDGDGTPCEQQWCH